MHTAKTTSDPGSGSTRVRGCVHTPVKTEIVKKKKSADGQMKRA